MMTVVMVMTVMTMFTMMIMAMVILVVLRCAHRVRERLRLRGRETYMPWISPASACARSSVGEFSIDPGFPSRPARVLRLRPGLCSGNLIGLRGALGKAVLILSFSTAWVALCSSSASSVVMIAHRIRCAAASARSDASRVLRKAHMSRSAATSAPSDSSSVLRDAHMTRSIAASLPSDSSCVLSHSLVTRSTAASSRNDSRGLKFVAIDQSMLRKMED